LAGAGEAARRPSARSPRRLVFRHRVAETTAHRCVAVT
jgi:hypothetical protein